MASSHENHQSEDLTSLTEKKEEKGEEIKIGDVAVYEPADGSIRFKGGDLFSVGRIDNVNIIGEPIATENGGLAVSLEIGSRDEVKHNEFLRVEPSLHSSGQVWISHTMQGQSSPEHGGYFDVSEGRVATLQAVGTMLDNSGKAANLLVRDSEIWEILDPIAESEDKKIKEEIDLRGLSDEKRRELKEQTRKKFMSLGGIRQLQEQLRQAGSNTNIGELIAEKAKVDERSVLWNRRVERERREEEERIRIQDESPERVAEVREADRLTTELAELAEKNLPELINIVREATETEGSFMDRLARFSKLENAIKGLEKISAIYSGQEKREEGITKKTDRFINTALKYEANRGYNYVLTILRAKGIVDVVHDCDEKCTALQRNLGELAEKLKEVMEEGFKLKLTEVELLETSTTDQPEGKFLKPSSWGRNTPLLDFPEYKKKVLEKFEETGKRGFIVDMRSTGFKDRDGVRRGCMAYPFNEIDWKS
ncbi:MAG: hypothetical protein HQ530_05020 [Parcubacteria group bacterium]|nr:hypothetical protein [Parcubacteria group bacterium]